MRAHLTTRLLAATLLTAGAASAGAQVINTVPGTGFVATGIASFQTSGADMGGMNVTAYFTDGSVSAGSWGDLGGGTWGVSTGLFSLTLGAGADTFGDPWQLLSNVAGGPGLVRLVLNGAPGKTVFDQVFGAEETPNSANGRPFTYPGGVDVFGTTATYMNVVGIAAALPLGDLYETLDIVFQTPVGPNGLQFITDTDNINRGGTITQTPEPATYTMLFAGVAALLAADRRRRRVA